MGSSRERERERERRRAPYGPYLTLYILCYYINCMIAIIDIFLFRIIIDMLENINRVIDGILTFSFCDINFFWITNPLIK